jgi:sugar/nucleoside kinase (ribokinase family)
LFPSGRTTVTFIGTAVIDQISTVDDLPGPNETVVVTSACQAFGGRGAGPAATYGALGGKAVLVTTVGTDFISSGFEHFLLASGVNMEAIAREASDVCFSTNTYISARTREAFAFFEPRVLETVVHENTEKAIRTAEAMYVAGFYSHDTLRLAAEVGESGTPLATGLCGGIVPYVSDDLLNALVRSSCIVAFNEEEWTLIRRRLDLRKLPDLFELSPNLECIYHTRGSNPGVGCLREGTRFEITVRRVEQTKSTIGAGDTFMAGVLYGRTLGLDFAKSARVGSLLASLNVENSLGATFTPVQSAELKITLDSLLRADETTWSETGFG